MKKNQILLIEDDQYISRAYQEGLEYAGFKIDVAHDGAEGMKKVRLEKPDLILLDLIMPIKSGYQVLKELKADENLKDIPVIILTNLDDAESVSKAAENGVFDFLVKSDWTLEQLVKRIKDKLNIV